MTVNSGGGVETRAAEVRAADVPVANVRAVDMRAIVQGEARRLEQESTALARAHLVAASRWSRLHFAIGIPSTLLAGATSVAAFAEAPIAFLGISTDQVAGVTALFVGLFSALSTFLDSNQKAGAHRAAWARYESLKRKARLVAEFDLNMDEAVVDAGTKDSVRVISQLSADIDEVNAMSPQVSVRVAL